MYSSILFPVDLEHEGSWTVALPVVKKLAATFGASVHVLTVVAEVRGALGGEFYPADLEERLVSHARERIADFVKTHLGDVAKVDAYVEPGRPYKQIVATAERIGCDLIIMGSHKPGMLDILIGPNADNVVRHTKASVMVVRE